MSHLLRILGIDLLNQPDKKIKSFEFQNMNCEIVSNYFFDLVQSKSEYPIRFDPNHHNTVVIKEKLITRYSNKTKSDKIIKVICRNANEQNVVLDIFQSRSELTKFVSIFFRLFYTFPSVYLTVEFNNHYNSASGYIIGISVSFLIFLIFSQMLREFIDNVRDRDFYDN